MAKNKIQDLRDHLFAQLERLGDDTLMKNPLVREREIERSKAITEVGQAIVNSAKVEIDFLKAISIAGTNGIKTDFLGIEEKK